MVLSSSLVDAYLGRLGVEAEPPSPEALARLHRAHVERVPWETLWIQMGERWGIDPVESARRIAEEGRGGYCFHLNGAFGLLLEALGYEVTRHIGGVHGLDGPSEDELTNHLVLAVHGLATDDDPSGSWYVDVGLGDALHDPLPLRPGRYPQSGFTFELATHTGPTGDWRFIHDPSRSYAGMSWLARPTDIDAFAARHEHLSTSPDSPFVRWLVVQRRHPDGVDVLRGLHLSKAGTGPTRQVVEDSDTLLDVLRDVFGLDIADRSSEERAALWTRVWNAHLTYVGESPPAGT